MYVAEQKGTKLWEVKCRIPEGRDIFGRGETEHAAIADMVANAQLYEREECADVADKYGDVEIRDAINLRDS